MLSGLCWSERMRETYAAGRRERSARLHVVPRVKDRRLAWLSMIEE